jgi:hypothetical protein
MERIKVVIILIAALLVAFHTNALCYADDLSQIVKTSDGFTIHLPEYWIAIPQNVLDSYSEAVSKMMSNTEKQPYAYGFQLSSSQNWLDYPYILIQVKKSGRISEGQLKSIKKVRRELDKGVKKNQDKMATIVSDVQVGETIYDFSSHILFSKMDMDVRGIGLVKGFMAILLTEEGAIEIFCYATASEFSDYAPIFERIARGVVVDDRLKYKTRIIDSIPFLSGIDWSKAIKGAIIGVIIALIAGLFRKR